MRVFVVYSSIGLLTGRRVGTELAQVLHGKAEVARGRLESLEQINRGKNKPDIIVNFGCVGWNSAPGTVVLNSPVAIAASSNKKSALKKLYAEGLPIPPLWDTPQEIDGSYPIVARTTNHSRGAGFWFCKDQGQALRAQAEGASHYLKYIPNTREFRIHVMANKPNPTCEDDYLVIKTSEKVSDRPKASEIIKNVENGWVFNYPADRDSHLFPPLRKIAKRAVALFGLHWGAVDIMVSKDDGKVYILEINSTPSLADDAADTAEKYLTGIKNILINPAPAGLQSRRIKPKGLAALLERLGI